MDVPLGSKELNLLPMLNRHEAQIGFVSLWSWLSRTGGSQKTEPYGYLSDRSGHHMSVDVKCFGRFVQVIKSTDKNLYLRTFFRESARSFWNFLDCSGLFWKFLDGIFWNFRDDSRLRKGTWPEEISLT